MGRSFPFLASLVLPLLVFGSVITSHSGHTASPVSGGFRASVLLVSGDGGWSEVERDLAAGFAVQRITVAGVDSRTAYSVAHSLSEIADDIQKSIEKQRRPVILVGYSFGADLLPLVWPELPRATQDKVITIALIAPTYTGSTLVDPTDRYDPREHPMTRLDDHHARLPAEKLMCIFGREERFSGYSSCPSVRLARSHLIEIDGGHDLGGRAMSIAAEIAKFAREKVRALAHLD